MVGELWGSGRGAVWVPLQGARKEGDDQLWGSGRGAMAGCRGAIAGCLGAIAGCQRGVTTNFGGVDAGCHIRVPL